MTTVPSADAKAVVRAAEALTTQVRRIADALTAPVVVDLDGTRTTPDDDPPAACWHTEPGTPCDWDVCRQAERLAAGDRGVDPGAVKTSRPFPRPTELLEDERPMREHLRAEEDQALRWARRESLLVLLTRLQRGRTLTEDEARTLRHHVETELREADTARAVARSNLRHVQMIVPELETAQEKAGDLAETVKAQRREIEAADKVRAEVQRDRDQHAAVLAEVLATFVHKVPGYRIPRVRSSEVGVVTLEKWRSVVAPTAERPWWQQVTEAQARVRQLEAAIREVLDICGDQGSDVQDILRPALDGTEQPTTCTATIPAVINSTPDQCVAPAGHYDESNEPVFTGPERSPGGWHTNGKGHVWSDRAAAATPHAEQPTTEA